MNISARRNKIFLLMEEVRRLRIQQRIKGGEKTREEEVLWRVASSLLAVQPLYALGIRQPCLCLLCRYSWKDTLEQAQIA